MRIVEAVRTIGEFWKCAPLPWAGGGVSHLKRLEQEFNRTLPDELRTYIRDFAPGRVVEFQQIGNPIALYGLGGDQRLGFEQLGYNRHGFTGETLEEWQPAWLVLADQGGDPMIVDLSRGDTQVLQAMHGAGAWNFWPIADTIGQFVLCAAAVHHTLVKWSDQLDDEDLGDDLPPEAADWLFPRMRTWSGEYYGRWCEDFTNA